jgi:hypothetical protein
MVGRPVQVEGLAGVVERLEVAALPLLQVCQVAVSVGPPGWFADPGRYLEGVPELGVCVAEATQPGIGGGEDAMGAGLCR